MQPSHLALFGEPDHTLSLREQILPDNCPRPIGAPSNSFFTFSSSCWSPDTILQLIVGIVTIRQTWIRFVPSLKCQFSRFWQIIGVSMYPSMYQVVYVKKTFLTLVSSKPLEWVYIFCWVRSLLEKFGAAQKWTAPSSIGLPNHQAVEIKTILKKSAFLLGTPVGSGINY